MAFKKLKLWFDKDLAILLGKKIKLVHPSFNSARFAKAVDKAVEPLELKDRVEVMANLLYKELGGTYIIGIQILISCLGPENEEETGMFKNFYWVMPIAKYVEKYGLEEFDASMQAILEITKRNTGEYTIRPYLEQNPKETLKVMKSWAKDPNRHVRRLASEGIRPRLPWATKLDAFIKNPKPLVPILNILKDDPSKYVQKSVANCLNDIIKDHPDYAKSIIEGWNTPKATTQRTWIIKHAIRNLLKKNDPWALEQIK